MKALIKYECTASFHACAASPQSVHSMVVQCQRKDSGG